MSRQRLLLITIVALIAANIVWHTYRNRGLVTINATGQPLSEVIRKIEKQGKVKIASNVPIETPVTMNVKKVPVSEALETLATVTDANWRLSFFLAPDKATVRNGIDAVKTGQPLTGWKVFYMRVPSLLEDEVEFEPDPRGDTWTVTAPPEATLHAYLENGSRTVNASFTVPESWNPPVSSTPKSGKVHKVVSKLASLGNGTWEETFLLTRGFRRGPGGDDAGPPPEMAQGEGPRGRGQGFNRDAMQQRLQAEIEKLPPDKRVAAQARLNDERAFWEGLRDLSPEERRAKMEERAADPAVQERREERMARRDARMTPQQRMQRYQRYVSRKQQAKAQQNP